MGDRGNIVVKDGGSEVYLYTHWKGSEIESIARKALSKGWRWTDQPYLARIVFQEMIGDDAGESGFGISSQLEDNEHKVLVIDAGMQTVAWHYEVGTGYSPTPITLKSIKAFVDSGMPEPEEG